MFLLEAPLKDYIWGGEKLKTLYGKKSTANVAESWELSTHPNGLSVIRGGPFDGQTLWDVLREHPDLAETGSTSFASLPILFKLIDSKEPLSIQVHPDDAYAGKEENSSGKTECWYILDASDDAFLYLGLSAEISKERFRSLVQSGKVESVLNRVPVKKGEIYFIPSGLLHAIGSGVTLAELQQSSDLTYRVYDYNRTGKDGKPRPLHLEKALDVISFKTGIPPVPGAGKPEQSAGGWITHVLRCPLFCLTRLDVRGQMDVPGNEDRGRGITAIDGSLFLDSGREKSTLEKGTSAFLSAGEHIRIHGNGSALLYGY